MDVSMTKAIDPEGELTDGAKQALAEARATPDSEYVPLEWIGKSSSRRKLKNT